MIKATDEKGKTYSAMVRLSFVVQIDFTKSSTEAPTSDEIIFIAKKLNGDYEDAEVLEVIER